VLFLSKKIVCPAEFSKPARRGVDAAFEMAEKFSNEPILVHVITLPPWRSGSFQGASNKERQTPHGAMARWIKESVPSQIKYRTQIIGGKLVRPAGAIVQLSAEEAADLTVLASQRQSG
jgi:nucleotide-binding universal stress UspA family protein